MPVLRVTGGDGGLVAVVFGYACHCTVLDSYKFCGDYAGFAQVDLEKSHPGAQAMFVAGCGATKTPSLAAHSSSPSATANNSLKASSKPSAGRSESIDGPIADRVRRDRPGLRRTADERPDRARREVPTISSSPAAPGELLKTIESRGHLEPTYPYPVETWRLGDADLGVSGRRSRRRLLAPHQSATWARRNLGFRILQRRDGLYSLAPRLERRGLRRGWRDGLLRSARAWSDKVEEDDHCGSGSSARGRRR